MTSPHVRVIRDGGHADVTCSSSSSSSSSSPPLSSSLSSPEPTWHLVCWNGTWEEISGRIVGEGCIDEQNLANKIGESKFKWKSSYGSWFLLTVFVALGGVLSFGLMAIFLSHKRRNCYKLFPPIQAVTSVATSATSTLPTTTVSQTTATKVTTCLSRPNSNNNTINNKKTLQPQELRNNTKNRATLNQSRISSMGLEFNDLFFEPINCDDNESCCQCCQNNFNSENVDTFVNFNHDNLDNSIKNNVFCQECNSCLSAVELFTAPPLCCSTDVSNTDFKNNKFLFMNKHDSLSKQNKH
ncbi:hypothetical protein HELRODRAFT_177211 [Helobdella robusta]|uniref:Uncharacterized protein n=1 Tax=Helobdella robusta TaxID=6412 RepID=T1FBC9_HELRO|nr:hypothetical protein HELRODRAFT_177211 [Helobdella robusta]ESN98325.1 hypothetical protein HELRODRAFT_177211 [Helobdella robusta]